MVVIASILPSSFVLWMPAVFNLILPHQAGALDIGPTRALPCVAPRATSSRGRSVPGLWTEINSRG